MDLKEFFQREYVTADEIEPMISSERVVTILGNERVKTEQYAGRDRKVMYLDVQFATSKEIRPLKLGTKGYPGQACKTLKGYYGTDTAQWVGKTVELIRIPYGDGKYTIGCRPSNVVKEVIGNAV